MTTNVYNHVFALHSFTIWGLFFCDFQRWCEDRVNMRPETLTQLTSSVTRFFLFSQQLRTENTMMLNLKASLFPSLCDIWSGGGRKVSKLWLGPWKLFIKPLLIVLADSFKQQPSNVFHKNPLRHPCYYVLLRLFIAQNGPSSQAGL